MTFLYMPTVTIKTLIGQNEIKEAPKVNITDLLTSYSTVDPFVFCVTGKLSHCEPCVFNSIG